MYQDHVSTSTPTTPFPTAMRFLLSLPHTIEHPSAALRYSCLQFVLGDLDVLGVRDEGSVVCIRGGGEGVVRWEEDAPIGMRDCRVQNELSMRRVGRQSVSTIS